MLRPEVQWRSANKLSQQTHSCQRDQTWKVSEGETKRQMDGVVQSHVVLLVVDGIMMMISVLLITTDQKDLRPERQVQEKEIILSYSFKQ